MTSMGPRNSKAIAHKGLLHKVCVGVSLCVLFGAACTPPVKICNDRALGPTLPKLPIYSPGQTVFLDVTSSASACDIPESDLRATAELFTSDGNRTQIDATSVVIVTATNGTGALAKASFTFTPTVPGDFTIRVLFEPGLGARSLSTYVARSPTMGQAISLTQSQCAQGIFQTKKGLVLCENNNSVSSYRNGLLLETRAGHRASVVGNVVWLESPDAGVILRLEDDGTTLVETARAAFAQSDILGESTEFTALRRTNNELLRFIFDGGTLQKLPLKSSANTVYVRTFLENQTAWFTTLAHGICLQNADGGNDVCPFSSRTVVGLSDGFLFLGNPLNKAWDKYSRPLKAPLASPANLSPDTIAPLSAQHIHGNSPMFIASGAALLSFETKNGIVDVTQYPAGNVISASRDFVVLATDGGVLIFNR
jgi:hypothetical protein